MTTLREVKELTERNGFAGYPVVTEENELVGIITGRDVRKKKKKKKKYESRHVFRTSPFT